MVFSFLLSLIALLIASVVGIVDKYSERNSVVAFTTIEGKNIQKYSTGWKEAIRMVNERIHEDFHYRAVSVFSSVLIAYSSTCDY